MSQPYDRQARVSLPNALDPALGEFWVENPWELTARGFNLSAYERKRIYWNVRGGNFLDISHLTSADGDGDGRSVVAGDFRNNGQMDLVVRQAGGGPLLLYENHFPPRHYLEVSLRGRQSNRLGIGARLTAVARGRAIVRELFPHNSFLSQAPSVAHFGLGDATRLERLTVRWPSGKVQELTDLAADRHIVIDEDKEGQAAIETVQPGRTIQP